MFAFNGFSIGKGHLAEAKAAINTGADLQPAAGGCSSNGSARDELLAKIRGANGAR